MEDIIQKTHFILK